MGIPYCGTHWILNRNNTLAFLSYHIRARIHIDHPFYKDREANVCTQSFGLRVYDGMDMMHPADTPNRLYCWKTGIRLLLILNNSNKEEHINSIELFNTFPLLAKKLMKYYDIVIHCSSSDNILALFLDSTNFFCHRKIFDIERIVWSREIP